MVSKEDVFEFMRKIYNRQEDGYSDEVLAFSFMLGLPPKECIGMYPESDWDAHMLNLYDYVVGIIHAYQAHRR